MLPDLLTLGGKKEARGKLKPNKKTLVLYVCCLGNTEEKREVNVENKSFAGKLYFFEKKKSLFLG